MAQAATENPQEPLPLDPRTAPVPRYGQASLSDLLPAVVTAQGMEGLETGLRLEPADRACVFLVDGLGWDVLRAHPEEAPFLTSMLETSLNGTGTALTAGFPSTTATSLASVGTGLPPGVHGLPGYTALDPDTGRLMNQLRWQPWTDPGVWQPYPTVFRLAEAAGITASQVSAPHFEETPLTQVALSGGTFLGVLSAEDRMDQAAARLAAADRTLVYTYYAELDGHGHRYGIDSDAWRGQLMYVDRLAERLAEQLPPRSALYITADHGMVDVPLTPEARFDVDEDWELSAGVAQLGGEGRMRHLYAVPGAARDVASVWREVLAGHAWVATREEAVELGWFGPRIDARVHARIGDVVAAMSGDAAVVATEREPKESALIGMHGSATAAEQLVPLLEVRT
ncbi:alkaline phosphatase family protein [Streptomyces marispadix]|uniref:Alkaline phosphatase family protein n=1 Tax=Streptomyces marispadix TaxID=2922868 RepID=A0ABS9T3N0_9ACTN|nr:nucleotide pyrophosphatase/phosphodiesterase family protein [Streptomyces marispadix]MCH6163058.1 alkaline phosphatase family protein [Streptomyces marispadix]